MLFTADAHVRCHTNRETVALVIEVDLQDTHVVAAEGVDEHLQVVRVDGRHLTVMVTVQGKGSAANIYGAAFDFSSTSQQQSIRCEVAGLSHFRCRRIACSLRAAVCSEATMELHSKGFLAGWAFRMRLQEGGYDLPTPCYLHPGYVCHLSVCANSGMPRQSSYMISGLTRYGSR